MTGEIDRFEYERPWMYPEQHDAMFNDADIAVCNASSKSGKSFSARCWLIEQALTCEPGLQVWWVAPSVKQAYEIGYEQTVDWLRPLGENFYRKNNNDRVIRILPRNVKMVFHTDDDPDTLYGRDVAACVIDEGSRVDEDAWTAVQTTLTHTDGRARIIGNVKGRNNWTWDLAKRAEAGEGWTCELCGNAFAEGLHSSTITFWHAVLAGVLDPTVIEKRRRMMSERAFRELFLARPGDVGENPFGTEYIEKCVGPLSHEEPIAFGCDLGRRQNLTVLIGLDREGHVCRRHEWRAGWDQTIEKIIERTDRVPTLVDETQQGDVVCQVLASHGAKNVEGQGFWNARVKATLFERLAVAIQRQEIQVPRGPIRDQLHAFRTEETESRTLYKPGYGSADDYVDALALALAMWDRQKTNPLAGRKAPEPTSISGPSRFALSRR